MSKEILILGKETFDKLKPDVQRFIKQQSKQISDLETKLADMEQEQIAEMQEHQESMKLADKTIKELETKLAKSEEQRQHLKNWLDNEILTSVDHESYYATINEYEEEVNKLKQQLAEKEKAIENWQTMYESVVQTCHNDKEEIERLNKQLAMQENTITNLIEDNRASQEWYKQQLAKKDDEITQRLVIQERDYEQDKISFAVEQLEKVKEYIHGKYLDETWHNKIVDEDREDTHDFIDNQIKAIKEGGVV